MDAFHFLKEFNRMCNNKGDECDNCRVYQEFPVICMEGIGMIKNSYDMRRITEIVEEWSKENPIKSNADKFREIFLDWEKQCGTSRCINECSIGYQSMAMPCSNCKWWAEEYKGDE